MAPPPTDYGLDEFVRQVYLVILGFGFAIFAETILMDLPARGTALVPQLVYFAAVYYFIAYDWLAYNVLSDRFPYPVSATAPFGGLGRFYADLAALLVKAFIVFIATQPLTYRTLLFAGGLFAVWHLVIAGWFLVGRMEGVTASSGGPHLRMSLLYAGLTAGAFAANRTFGVPPDAANLPFVVLLSGVVVAYSTVRTRTLIRTRLDDSAPDSAPVVARPDPAGPDDEPR